MGRKSRRDSKSGNARIRGGKRPGIAASARSFVVAAAAAGLLGAVAAVPLVGGVGILAKDLAAEFNALPAVLELVPLPQHNRVLDEDGNLIATFYSENRVPVTLNQVSQPMKDAILAIEDARFYEHGPLDVKGASRAFLTNLQAGGIEQGASSITQQLVKNTLISAAGDDAEKLKAAREQSLERKIQELRYAIELEKRLSKDEILERYLNIAYFGSGAYGVEAAARRYFNASAANLNLNQAATLAGLVRRPVGYDPSRDEASFEAATNRRDLVLDRMVELDMTTEANTTAEKDKRIELDITKVSNGCYSAGVSAPLFCQYVENVVLSDPAFGKTAAARQALWDLGGLTVRTTMDLQAQNAADRALLNRVNPADRAVGALAMVEPGTGAIRALAQSKRLGLDGSPGTSDLNLAVDQEYGGGRGFQSGSTMKVFTAAAALERGIGTGYTLNAPYHLAQSTLGAEKDCNGNWVGRRWPRGGPYNESPAENGPYTMSEAMALSVNNYFIRLTDVVGLCRVVQMAARLGVHRGDIYTTNQAEYDRPAQNRAAQLGLDVGDRWPLDEVYTFTLGVNTVSPLTMASAYATFASGGVYCTPHAIASVTDRSGRKLEVPGSACEQVISSRVARTMNAMLQGVMTGGTGRSAAIGRPAGGKTGTTNNKIHVWFIGYTPQLSTAVAVGNPTNYRYSLNGKVIGGRRYGTVFGANLPAPIWREAMLGALEGVPATRLP